MATFTFRPATQERREGSTVGPNAAFGDATAHALEHIHHSVACLRWSLLIAFCAGVAACSSTSSESTDPSPSSPSESGVDSGLSAVGNETFVDAGLGDAPAYSNEDIWADDPPPQWCGPDGGASPPPSPGGTPECPDDKNREGCPCKTLGEVKPCWPGRRVNRQLGICVDGTTRCGAKGELDRAWGKCEGYVLPLKDATKGKAACKCFSQGQWKLDVVTPCFVGPGLGSFVTSSNEQCSNGAPSNALPTEPWTTNSLTVDCAGHFKLCYTLKVADPKNPAVSDCTLTSVCTEADYVTPNVPQAFPPLPGWVSNDQTCVERAIAGERLYGEMSVIGKSVLCDTIDDSGKPLVFTVLNYCPPKCGANPTDPECQNCKATGGNGSF